MVVSCSFVRLSTVVFPYDEDSKKPRLVANFSTLSQNVLCTSPLVASNIAKGKRLHPFKFPCCDPQRVIYPDIYSCILSRDPPGR